MTFLLRLCVFLLVASPVFSQQTAERISAPKKVVPVAMLVDLGVGGKGPDMMEETLNTDGEFRVTRLLAEEIRAGKLKDYRALIVPGGTSSTIGAVLGGDGRKCIKDFVADGGIYVGVCAGCYLGSSHYKWSLHLIPVKVVDSANWARGRADLNLELTSDGKEWFRRSDSTVKTIYHNGPVLAPMKEAGDKVIPLAIYQDEVVKKGAKTGLMASTPAIVASQYGKGWAIGISPHPEQTEGLKDLLPSSLRWTLGKSTAAPKATPSAPNLK